MPDYNAYNAGLQGFMTGRKLAREDRAYKQEQEGNKMLTGLMEKEYNSMNPEGQPMSFGDIDPQKAMIAVNFARQKAQEVEAKAQKEVAKGIEILKLGIEAASKNKGPVANHLTVLAWKEALPFLQPHGYFKGVNFDELEKKINSVEEKEVVKLIKDLNSISEGMQNKDGVKTITPQEAHVMTNRVLERLFTIENPDERKVVTDRISEIRKQLTPEKPKTPQLNDLIAGQLRDKLGREPTEAEMLAELDNREEVKDKRAVSRAVRIEVGKFGAQTGMVSDNDKEQIYQYYKKTGKYPPEFNRLFRIPGAQMEIIGYVNDRSKLEEVTGSERAENEINWKALEKTTQTANNPTFQRMIKAGKILIEGSTDPKTGKKNEAEMDKIIRLRNEIPDALFGQISNKLRAFNSWDQFIKYQVSDPKMAELKGTVVANAERLGAIYSGGGTVTSDQKIKLALELLDSKLGKQAFAQLVNSHKDSIRNTIGEYQTITPNTPFATGQPAQTQPTGRKPLSAY